MNEKNLNRLFALARGERPPAPSADFAGAVLRAIRREPMPARRGHSLWDQLEAWFPRVAAAAAGIIILCAAADWALAADGTPDMTEGPAQMVSPFLNETGDL